MILNSESVMTIDLNNTRISQLSGRKLDKNRLPYITPNRFEDIFNAQRPSFLNNYRQSGTNQKVNLVQLN